MAGATVTALASRRRGPLGNMIYLVLGIQTTLLAMIGIVVSPLLLLPSLAVGSIAVFASHPTSFKPVAILVFHTLAFITPFILEGLGVVPHTFWMEHGRLIVHPWAVDLAMVPLMVFVLATVPVQLVVNLFLTLHLRVNQERSEERLHLQSWHLRQLLPDAVEATTHSPRDSVDQIRPSDQA